MRLVLTRWTMWSCLVLTALSLPELGAQAKPPEAPQPTAGPFDHLEFRNIGPATMAGRVDDLAVLESNPAVFYVATATGGLWKTLNAGTTWDVLFDDLPDVVSIGDVAMAPDDPELVWVGSGENNNRQSSSWGNGVYKSTDGGHTWKRMGLADTRHIARIIVDPVDHDVVYVAALGHLWGPNKERGVFKTTDGGLTWSPVLVVDEHTGATELVMDPSNNKVLYAATYQRQRSTWGFNGGGPGSGIYKSGDAGRTWTKLSNGIPAGPLGRIGLDVYRKDPSVVYARIEHATESGVYRSDDGGANWRKMSAVNPRPMYFSQIRIDPNDDHRIYVLGVQIHISDDEGRTFVENGTLHSDHHAFWINPKNSHHVITGNDGGIGISHDRGKTWDFVDNMDLGQFYHVTYDMETPYNVYGGLQDNYSWGGPSTVRGRFGISNFDWFIIGGGDGFQALADPTDARILYAESQNGNIVRIDRTTNERKAIRPVPPRAEQGLRWNWNTPLQLSAHDPTIVFAGANRLYKSTDRGHSWAPISPDLTARIDREELSLMGVVAKDFTIAKHDGLQSYGNLVAFSESPKRAGIYYTGADDGTVQVSRDDGKTWNNISTKFPGLPRQTYVSKLAASRFEDGTVYATFDGHRENDTKPYVFVSTNYGETWRSIASDLPDGHAVECITEDLKNANVLYVGTEFGLFVSLDRGARWTRIRANLPTVPIDEIVLHPRENDMILATHGRSIWILDDISPIQQAAAALSSESALFDTRPAMQMNPANDRTNFAGDRRFWGKNAPIGAGLTYFLRDAKAPGDVALVIRDAGGATVRQLTGAALEGRTKAGINRVLWDLRYEPLVLPGGAQTGGGGGGGFGGAATTAPFVLPGEYQVTLVVGGRDVGRKPVRVTGDRLIQITDADRKSMHDTAVALHGLQRTANQAFEAVQQLSDQIQDIRAAMTRAGAAAGPAKAAVDEADKQIASLRRRFGVASGGAGQGGGGGGQNQNVRAQIGQLKNQIMGSTSAPTEAQIRSAGDLRGDLTKAVDEVNALITATMPALYKTLAESKVLPGLTPIPAVK